MQKAIHGRDSAHRLCWILLKKLGGTAQITEAEAKEAQGSRCDIQVLPVQDGTGKLIAMAYRAMEAQKPEPRRDPATGAILIG